MRYTATKFDHHQPPDSGVTGRGWNPPGLERFPKGLGLLLGLTLKALGGVFHPFVRFLLISSEVESFPLEILRLFLTLNVE